MKTKDEVLDKLLPDGKFVTHATLDAYFGSNRATRQVISNYRKAGVIIINNYDGKGYKRLAMTKKNAPEIARWLEKEKARVRNLCKMYAPARRFLKNVDALF